MIKIGPVKGTNMCSSKGSSSSSEACDEWDDKGQTELLGFSISYSDSSITALQFMYAHNAHILFSHSATAFTGPLFKLVQFEYPSEYLSSVMGYYSYLSEGITSIVFTTNKKCYGPFGCISRKDDMKTFSFEWGPHNHFCGFHGKYGPSGLKAIGVYIKPVFAPKC